MGQKRTGTGRCPRCKLNNNLCLCAQINPLEIQSLVSLIVHVSELKLPSNTAQFVKLLLPEQTQLQIRGRVNEVFSPEEIVARPGTALFLYPHEDAQVLDEDFKARHPGPYHLIVPDGNWHQARRVRKREEALQRIPAVTLPPGLVGEYQLRKAQQPDWLSTYEATAHALGILEAPEVRDHMMDFFRLWVRTTLYNRTKSKIYL